MAAATGGASRGGKRRETTRRRASRGRDHDRGNVLAVVRDRAAALALDERERPIVARLEVGDGVVEAAVPEHRSP